jgi:hypothetical protein
MSGNRIKVLTIDGFRGAQTKLSVDLGDGQPLLVYGNNGSGKSTIADAVEWFYFDKISHLRGEDFAKKHDGVRNKDIPTDKVSSVEFCYRDKKLNCTKQLSVKNGAYKTTATQSQDIEAYFSKSQKENILIRNAELINFIISTKSDRLSDISDLIGYSEVTKMKQLLRKGVGDITSVIKGRAFESQITSKQGQLLSTINSNAYDDTQFYAAVDVYVKPLGLDYAIASSSTLEKLKTEFEKVKPSQADILKAWLKIFVSNLSAKSAIYDKFLVDYGVFKKAFAELVKDGDKVKGLQIKALLEAARTAIEKKVHEDPSCPICLQAVSSDQLISSLGERISALKMFEEAKNSLDTKKIALLDQVRNLTRLLRDASKNEHLLAEEVKGLKPSLDTVLSKCEELEKKFEEPIDLFKQGQFQDLTLKADEWTKLFQAFDGTEKAIQITNDPRIKMGQAVALAESLFADIKKLNFEKAAIDRQKNTLEKIFNEFSNLQKVEISKFLAAISGDMNDFFKFMNPHELIDSIELKTVEDSEGDFVGIAYHLNFRGTQLQTPQAYMSESYLNCLGLCLFLASVKTFNKENKFFVLDDVISSFDKGHRILFARLLVEKFGDWQPLILTHEDEWFSYLASLVKSKNWVIKTTKWTLNGAIIETKLAGLQEEIERKFKINEPSGLGNLLGRYTETLLKELCENLEAALPYRPNSYNEDRSFDELFNAIRTRLKDKKTGLDQEATIQNMSTTQFFRNKTSHGNGFGENIADMRVCYDDICKFEKLFTCPKGNKLSVEYFDPVTLKIRTKSGELQYDWK